MHTSVQSGHSNIYEKHKMIYVSEEEADMTFLFTVKGHKAHESGMKGYTF